MVLRSPPAGCSRVLLGSGKRLFADDSADKTRLELVEHAAYSNGIQLAVYDVKR